MFYFLKRADFKNLIKALDDRWEVFLPVKNSYGDVRFERFGEGFTDLSLIDFKSQTLIPPKEVFFPQSEVMFKYSESGKSGLTIETESEINPSKPKLIFGVKPCDYNAIMITDRFFIGNERGYVDYYYELKASKSLIIIAACLTPPEPDACFCTSSGTGPFLEKEKGDSYDIQIIEIKGNENGFNEGFIVETASDRGEDFIAENESFFESLDEVNTREMIVDLRERAIKNVQLKLDFRGAIEKIASGYGLKGYGPKASLPKDNGLSENTKTGGKANINVRSDIFDIYERIADRCIYCGACLYACPTCSCFNVYDNSNSNSQGTPEGERVRVWDGCVFSGYTREASGHNPRDEAYKRAARRYEHKLFYDVELYGRSSCVGCGRCLTACPVDIGMSKFIEELSRKKLLK